jgi:DNA-binding XRE family transcriptional regulator
MSESEAGGPDEATMQAVGITPSEITRRRLALRWSKADLADHAGITRRSVYNAEKDHVGEQVAAAIEAALDAGEAEQLRADEPEMATVRYTLSTSKGEVDIVVTANRELIPDLDLGAVVREALRRDP